MSEQKLKLKTGGWLKKLFLLIRKSRILSSGATKRWKMLLSTAFWKKRKTQRLHLWTISLQRKRDKMIDWKEQRRKIPMGKIVVVAVIVIAAVAVAAKKKIKGE